MLYEVITTKSSTPPPVWCMVLAAGKSTRMKQQKLLMWWNGQTIIETVVQKALDSFTEKVLIVTGSHNEEIKNQIRQMPVLTIKNKDFANGRITSYNVCYTKLLRFFTSSSTQARISTGLHLKACTGKRQGPCRKLR